MFYEITSDFECFVDVFRNVFLIQIKFLDV